MANPYTSQAISGYNTSPPADDGTQISANQIKWSNHKTKLADPIKTLAEAINTELTTAFATVDDASNLTTGTLPDARLSSNVPLKNAANTFTDSQTISHATGGGLTVTEVDTGATWNFFVSANVLRIQRTDGGTSNAILVSGDGAGTVTSIAMTATNITANGDEVLTEGVVAALTNVTVADTQPTDSLYINDGGVGKQIDIQDMGIRVVELATIQTFALGDVNTLQTLTGATDRVWTIPANATVAFGIGSIIYLAARDTAKITVTAATGVTLTSVLGSGAAGSDDVSAGGMAALVKVATDEWMLSGDIA